MIATHAYYLVAFPHSTVHPTRRIKRLKLGPDADGKDILGLLKDAYPDNSSDLDDATIWKASGLASADVNGKSDDEIYERIREGGLGIAIQLEHTMAMVFPEGLHEAKEEQIEIVAMTPEIVEAMTLRADLLDGNLRHMEARAELAKTMRTIGSPSEIVKSPASIKVLLEAPNGPRYGRPSGHTGPPTALFSPALALLGYDLGHLDDFEPDTADIAFAFNLIENATSSTDDAGEREAVLRSILGKFLEDNRKGSGGTWLEGTFAYPIIEIKHEQGRGGDPFLQGLLVYSKTIAQEECQTFLSRSNLPVVLLAIAGTRLTVSTAIYTDSVYADELLSLDLCFGHLAGDNTRRAARVFMAIRKCTERLHELYRNLGATTRLIPAAKILWPNPTSDPPGSTEGIPELEFFSKVDRSTGAPINQTILNEENKGHAMYLARMRNEDGTSTKNVFVKFAVKYDAATHRLLANNNPPLAPALYSCTPVLGGMFMVIVEYFPGASLRDAPSPLPVAVYEAVRRDVSRALELLHEQDLVFGHLVEENLLYLPEDVGRALLVDFENWHIMEESHDIEDFGRLMDRLSGLR